MSLDAYFRSAVVDAAIRSALLDARGPGGTPPTVLSVVVDYGSHLGGDSVLINGTGFQPGATVMFNGNAATSVSVISPVLISCTTPAHAGGTVDVTVSNPDGGSATLVAGFCYWTTASLYVWSSSTMLIGRLSRTNRTPATPYPGPPYYAESVNANLNATVNIGKNVNAPTTLRARKLFRPMSSGPTPWVPLVIPAGIVAAKLWLDAAAVITGEDFLSLDAYYTAGDPTLVATYQDFAAPIGSIARAGLLGHHVPLVFSLIELDVAALKAHIGSVFQVLLGTHVEDVAGGGANTSYASDTMDSYLIVYTD